jgi:soluble lytic murein transglycosylase-like protein
MSSNAYAQADEMAMAVPRLAPFGGDGIALPQPLAEPDAAIWRRLFASRATAKPLLPRDVPSLDLTVRLNDAMFGHFLAKTYLGPRPHAGTAELADWISRYPTLPDAPAIAALLHRRDPSRPLPDGLPPRQHPPTAAPAVVPEETEPKGEALPRSPVLDDAVRQRLHDGHTDTALRLIAHKRGLDPIYAASLRAEVAQTLFTQNRDDDALALAQQAVHGGQGRIGLADYVAGLAAWRLGRTSAAATHFAAAAVAPVASASLHAAGAYWAARACLALADMRNYRGWLTYAGAQRRTFYGQIANRILGRSDGLAFAREVLGEADVEAVAAEPAGLRAFALLQIGEPARAEAELRQLAGADRPALNRSIMLVAERAGFYDFAADLAASIQQQGGKALDGDRFPVPRLRPGHGFQMDPALVYALTRIESNFDPHAVSGEGAQGLMQLMPRTADYVAGPRAKPQRLHDPAVNLDLGQRYVAYLAGHDIVDGDLIRLLASYNSGPEAFARWSEDIRDFNDPLLFIEAMPNAETRAFVQRALAYTWIYAARLHLPAPSLDALAATRFPRFSQSQPMVQPIVLH